MIRRHDVLKIFAIGALLFPVSEAIAKACSISELTKVSTEALDRMPSGVEHEVGFSPFSTEGYGWQEFTRENDTPHSIVVTMMGETGQTKYRLSFLNRHDFAITETDIRYEKPSYALRYDENFERELTKEEVEKKRLTFRQTFKVSPSRTHYYCADAVQLSPGTPANAVPDLTKRANELRKFLFEDAKELRPTIDLVPEK